MQNSPINFDLPKHLKNLEKRISVVENRRPGTIYLDKKIVTKDPETGVETVFGDLSDYGEDRTGIKQWVNDVKPPEVVTAPWVTANLGVFSISWDGATASGDPMDADFKNLNVYGNDGTSTKMVGVLSNKDEVAVVTDATYGTPWVFWFTSVDFNGNESTPSASSDPKELTPLVESPDISEAIDAVYNKIQEDFTKSMVAANGKNRIWHTPDAPVADPNAPFIDGDTWFDTNDGNKIYIWKSLPAPAHWEAAVLDSSALDDKITDAIAEAKDQSDVAIETANGKNKAWHSPTQPTGTSHTVGDLWFDTANDNRISRWNGTAWVLEPIGTKAIAQSVNDAITDATTKANTAKTTADGKNTNYYSSTTPTAPTGGFKTGDTWFDTANGNRISRWNGTAWVLVPIGDKAIAQTVLDTITTAQSTATTAQTTANGKNTNYYSSTTPTAPTGGFKTGDTWFDTANDNRISRWNGTAWVLVPIGDKAIAQTVLDTITTAQSTATTAQTTANGKNTNYYSSTTPTAPTGGFKTGDTWFDTANDNRISRWNGTAWVLVPIGDKAIAQTVLDTITTAQSTATTAQTTANGKNTNYYSSTTPTAPTGGFKTGDTWFNSSKDNQINRWTGTAWSPVSLGTAGLGTDVTTAISNAKLAGDNAQVAANQVSSDLNATKTDFDSKINATTGLANAAQSTADTAKANAATAQSTADTAKSNAATAQSTADTAKSDAATASGIAGGKADVLIKPTAPATAMRKATTLWIDTTSGTNTPKRWNGTAWVEVTDKAAKDAATAAATAQTSANNAKTAADNAQTTANTAKADAATAQTAANNAQATADTAKANAISAQATADAANAEVDKLWSSVKRAYYWAGDTLNGVTASSNMAIVNVNDAVASSSVLRKTGVGSTAYFDGEPLPFDNSVLYKITAKVRVVTAGTTPTSPAFYVGVHAWKANATGGPGERVSNTGVVSTSSAHYFAAGPDSAPAVGEWATVTGYFQGSVATGAGLEHKDITDPGQMIEGTKYVSPMVILDYPNGNGTWDLGMIAIDVIPAELQSQIVLAQSAANAAQASANAAQTAAGNAQSSADSAMTMAGKKSTVLYATTVPVGTGTRVDDIWRQRDATDQVIGEWRWTGTAWQKITLTSGVFSNLDAGLLTAGTIQAERIGARSITADKIKAKELTANEIKAGTLTSASGVFGTVDASIINAGTLNSDRLNANDIRAKFLQAGKITADDMVTGTITAASGIIANIDASKITVGELNGNIIKSGTILASRLAVTDFLNYNPNMLAQYGDWDLLGGTTIVASTNSADDKRFSFPLGSPISYAVPKYYSDVLPGDKILINYTPQATSASSVLELYWQSDSPVGTGVLHTSNSSSATNVTSVSIEFTVPAKTNRIRFGLRTKTTNTAVVYAQTFIAQKMTGGTLIEDGAITTEKIKVGAITAASGIIASLDAGKISTGELNGSFIKAGTVLASRLAVTDFLNYNPNMLAQSGDWDVTGGTTIVASSTSADDKRFSFPLGSPVSYAVPKYYSDVLPGDKISVMYTPQSTSASSVLELYWQSDSPAASGILHTSTSSAVANITPVVVEFTVPAKTNRIRFGLRTKTTNTAVVFATTFVAQKMTGGTLIEDGAITTEKIKVGAITAASGIIASLDAGKISTGELNGSFIKAGTVLASRLAVTDFLNYNPNMLAQSGDWDVTGGTTIVASSTSADDKRFSFPLGSPVSYAVPKYYSDVLPGDKISVMYTPQSTSASSVLELYWQSDSPAASGILHTSTSSAVANITPVVVEFTVPAKTNRIRFGLRTKTTNTAVVFATTFVAQKMTGGTLIEDGAITTEKIKVGAITAASGIIASLDAGKISTGELNGSFIKAGTVLASRLAVTDFLNYNPNMLAQYGDWDLLGGTTIVASTNSADDKRFSFPLGSPISYAVPKYYSDVLPGDKILINYTPQATSASSVLELYWQSDSPVGTGVLHTSNSSSATNVTSVSIEFTVPAKTNRIRFGLRTKTTNTAVVYAQTFIAQKMTGGTLIEDGAITTEKIKVGAITAASGIIASLDAGKISTGELDGTFIKAGTVLADRLIVSATDNINRDPNFNFPDTMWMVSSEMGGGPERWSTDVTYAGGARSMVLTQRPQGSNQSSYAAVPTEFYEVIPGDSYSVSSMIYSDTGTDANMTSVSQQVYFYNSSKNVLSGAPGNQISGRTNAVDWVTGQWNKVGGITTLTVPEGAAYMRPRLTVYKTANVTPGTRKYYIGAISVMRAMDGTLITPEAITTPHIKTGAITAESGIIASLDAGKINTGSMHGKYIEAGTLLASTIAVRDNMNLLPNITYEAESWTLSNGATIIDSSLSAEKRRFNFPATALAQALSPDVQVIPGEKIKIECKTYGTSASQNLEIYWFGRDGKGGSAGSAVLLKSTTANETLVYEWEVPSTVFSVRFSVRVPTTTPLNTAVTGAYSFTARKMTGGVLIENGAVDADKIAANSITADNGKIASIDASKITVGELNGKLIKSGTVMSNSLVVGDFQNYATIDATRGVNVTNPAEWATDSEGEWTKSKVGAGSYLFFMDRGGPIPFKTGEKFRVSFTGYSTVNQTSTLCGYFYNGPDGGSVTYSPTINVPMTTTATEYSYEVTVPNISSITGSGSWVFGFYNTTANNIRVKDVRILKMTDSTVITGDAILTRHIATDAVESRNIKANAVTADKIIAGAITTVKIDAEAVDASKIKANAVTTVKLDAEAVTADKIKANAITAIKIKANAVTTVKLDAEAVTADKIKANAITAIKIDANAVTSDKIMSKAVIADKIAVGAITADKLDADAITGKTIRGGDLYMSSSDYSIEARTGSDGAYLGFRTPDTVTAGTIRATDEINIGGSTINQPALTLRSPSTSKLPERAFLKLLSWYGDGGGLNQPSIWTNSDLIFDSTNGAWIVGDRGLSLSGKGAIIQLESDSTSSYVKSFEVYNRTYSGNANAYVTVNGVIGRSTSALKYKQDVETVDLTSYEDVLLTVEHKSWLDRVEAENYQTYLEWEKENPLTPIPESMQEFPTSPPKRHYGAIADEFDEIGLTQFVTYGPSGEVEGLAYDRIGVALIPIIKKQRDKISVLEASLAETLTRIEALESK